MTDDLDDTDDFDDASFDENSSPPVTDLDMRMIIAALHDQGRGHVLADMIESATGERLPEGTFHPRKFPIRDPQWRAARKRLKKQRDRLYQRERQSSEAKAARIAALEEWKATRPASGGKLRSSEKGKLANLSQLIWRVSILAGISRMTGAIMPVKCTKASHAATRPMNRLGMERLARKLSNKPHSSGMNLP
ncbi:MAG TPA: hypothetical protein VIL70_07305 [Chthoniobacterales bacterium]